MKNLEFKLFFVGLFSEVKRGAQMYEFYTLILLSLLKQR